MNRSIRIASRLVLCAALAATASSAHAQYGRQGGRGQNFGGNQGNGATLNLPEGVRRVVGIDAQNVLLAELEPETPGGPSEYRAIPVKHVYVGGIAKLFGGETISTEEFVSPAYSRNGGGFGQINQGGNFGGAQGFGQNFGNGFGNGYGFNGGIPNGYNGYVNGVNGGVPYFNGVNDGLVPNAGVLPGGFPASGGFVGSPVVRYGVGNLTRSKNIQNPNGGTVTTQESR